MTPSFVSALRRPLAFARWSVLGVALMAATFIAMPASADSELVALPLQPETVDVLQLPPRPPALLRAAKRAQAHDFPYLPDEQVGRSFSVGTVTEGYVIASVALPEPGQHYAVLQRQRRRGLTHATQEVIDLLVRASEQVARQHPAPSILWLGNIGAPSGGDIAWSVSHNAGRDADLAFYTVTPDGRPVEPPDLLHYDNRGRSREYGGYYRFDVPRNWSLVKALIESPHASIQYLFISVGLRSLLLQHAQRVGEPQELLDRASAVLRQPGNALPHDDHLHLRVYCSRSDAASRCADIGIAHPWRPPLEDVLAARAELAVSLLRAAEPSSRIAAVRRLAFMRQRDVLDQIVRRFSDPVAQVRAAAADAIGEIGSERYLSDLVNQWEEESDAQVLRSLLLAMAQVGRSAAVPVLAGMLDQPTAASWASKSFDLRLTALQAITAAGSPSALAAVAPLLEDPDPEIRARAAMTTALISNMGFGDADPRFTTDTGREQWLMAVGRWRDLVGSPAELADLRDRGYALAGLDVETRGAARARALVRLLDHEDWFVRANVRRDLVRIAGHDPRADSWGAADLRDYWSRWLRRNDRLVASR
jgi:penicillin-insensitive murein endopeptidase